MAADSLNGFYEVVHTHEPIPGYFDHRGFIVLIDGRIEGLSDGGSRWHGKLVRTSPDSADATVTIDVADADATTHVLDASGKPTKVGQSYTARLMITTDGSRVQMDGTLMLGSVKLQVIVRRLQVIDG